MWEELAHLKELLLKKNYNKATKFFKKSITRSIEEGQHLELIIMIRKEMLFLNMSEDPNKTFLFCEKIMQYSLEEGLDIKDYVEQCRVLNAELSWYSEQYKEVISELYSLNPVTALHIILSIFENFNHFLLSNKPNDLERIHYFSYVYGMETAYESGISALNRLMELWLKSSQSGRFNGKLISFPYVPEEYKEFVPKLEPIIKSLNYLEWLCKEVSLHNVKMEINESEVTFIVNSYDEYRSYKLPFIRETARMQNALRTFQGKSVFGWDTEEIDYSNIIKIKEDGNDFRLEIDSNSFIESFKRSTETAYQTNLLIMEEMYITNMHEMKIKNTSVTVLDLFFFYYCLKTMALLYFEATQYFIQKEKKEAKAPYLNTDKNSIGEIFIPLLSKVLKRKVEQSQINELIDLFRFGSNNINDLYYKPLILNGDNVSLVPSLFIMNNFSKTFLHHMNELKVNLADRGELFETAIQTLLSQHGFDVHQGKYPYSYQFENQRINGDIDLIAKKDSYLFIGQLKNRLEPLEPKDYRGADKKITLGISQAEQSELYIRRNPDEFCRRFGITREELDQLTIQPFVLVSCFYGSGQMIRNIPVIDDSALFRFFDEGVINIFPGEGEPYTQKIRTPGDVLPEEFNKFLMDPYFLNPDIYGIQMATNHSLLIRSKKFTFGTGENWDEQYKQSLLAKAVEHFEKRGLLN